MNDSFTELLRLAEEIGYHLERFDFAVHNDDSNPENVEKAQRALADLTGALEDLVP